MFEESFQKVIISLNNDCKQCVFQTELALDESGCVLSSDLKYKIYLEGLLSQEDQLIFYYDHIRNNYAKVDEAQAIPLSGLVNQNKIIIRLQPKISDQILANPQPLTQNPRAKRSAQRSIRQSFTLVMRWRNIYNWGFQQKQGQIKNYNLDKAAQCVGVPRKSLQDYFLLLRIGKELQFNFSKFKQQKMGSLRQFIKSAPKISKQRQNKISLQKIKQKSRILQDQFFRTVGRQLQISQIIQIENEQKLYDVLIIDEESPRSHSDEDMIPGEIQQ